MSLNLVYLIAFFSILQIGCKTKNPDTNIKSIVLLDDTTVDNSIKVDTQITTGVNTIQSSESVDTFSYFSKNCTSDLIILNVDGLPSKIKNGEIQVKLMEQKNESVFLQISKGNSIIYKSDEIAGVSSLWNNNTYLLFIEYSLITEDGSNDGIPVMLNLLNGEIRRSKKIYSNCINPVIIDSNIFLIEELNLHILDFNLSERLQKNIEFVSVKNEENDYRYLDRFQFCYLNENEGRVIIGFKEEKTNDECNCYTGEISYNYNKIILYK